MLDSSFALSGLCLSVLLYLPKISNGFYTAISEKSDVHANHNEAKNSALRRRCSAYRRRQNLYAKNREGLQRTVTVQRLVHNWVRPHGGLGKNKTPVMAIALYHRPISMLELLSLRGFHSLTF